MIPRFLYYLGPEPSETRPLEGGTLACEGRPLVPGTRIQLARRRSPWREERDVERVLVGCLRDRSDVFLEGMDLEPDHARLYLSKTSGDVNDLRAIVDRTVWVNDRLVDHREWYALNAGDELRLGPWRFRFQIELP